MYSRPIPVETIRLDDAILRILDDMENVEPGSPDYDKLVTQLERLTLLKTTQRPGKISPDTRITVLANLLGILIIVAYEQKHVMGSKAQSFILKPKL